jgi:hypothetical protein
VGGGGAAAWGKGCAVARTVVVAESYAEVLFIGRGRRWRGGRDGGRCEAPLMALRPFVGVATWRGGEGAGRCTWGRGRALCGTGAGARAGCGRGTAAGSAAGDGRRGRARGHARARAARRGAGQSRGACSCVAARPGQSKRTARQCSGARQGKGRRGRREERKEGKKERKEKREKRKGRGKRKRGGKKKI